MELNKALEMVGKKSDYYTEEGNVYLLNVANTLERVVTAISEEDSKVLLDALETCFTDEMFNLLHGLLNK